MISTTNDRLQKKKGFLLCLVCLFLSSVMSAQASLRQTNQQWLEDLHYAKKTLVEKHPDIFYRLSEDEFNMAVAKAEQKIERGQTDEECLAAICQVVASIQDGHTVLGVTNLPGYRDIFPVRMYEFTNGIYITGIAKEFEKYIGAKVIEIGTVPAEEAFQRAGKLAFADNGFYRKEQTPLVVITCKHAFGLGITKTVERLRLLIETESKKPEEIYLFSVSPTGVNNMLRAIDIGPAGVPFASAFSGTDKDAPLFLRHLDGNHNYWFEHDQEHKAMYMQFNLFADHPDESFVDFSKRMFRYIDDNTGQIDKFILDLRFNNGGSGLLGLPFMNELIKRDSINQSGHLFTLIGRRSFSAAVLLAAEMMLHTRTLLVGEPAGAASNMFSDMVNRGPLPNSGAVLFVSSEYFNIAWPADRNHLLPPHYPAPFSSELFFAGKDPALEAIFADQVKAVATVLRENGAKAALQYFKSINTDWGVHKSELGIMPFTFPISRKYNGQNVINGLGYDLMNKDEMEEARAAFELNTLLFPGSFNAWDSYAEYFMRTGDNARAIEYYMKSLEINPDNSNAKEMLKKLEKK